MDNKTTELVKTVAAIDSPDQEIPASPKKEFVEPDVSEPVDILTATRVFLQITGGGDV